MILLSSVTGPVIGAIGASVVGGGGFLVGSFYASNKKDISKEQLNKICRLCKKSIESGR